MDEIETNETQVDETQETGVWQKAGNGLSKVLTDSETMNKWLPLLMVVIPPPYDVMAFAALTILSAVLGSDEDPHKLGYQMNQADKNMDDPEFGGDFEKYKDYLDKNVPFDAQAFAQLPPDRQLACDKAGLAGLSARLQHAKGFGLAPEALGLMVTAGANLKWGAPTFGKFAEGMKQSLEASGQSSFAPVVDAVRGELDPVGVPTVMAAIDGGLKAAGVSGTKADFLSAARR